MNGEEKSYMDERFNRFEEKLDKVHDSVLKLPCDVHIEKIKGLGVSIDRAWVFIRVLFIIIIGSGIIATIAKAVLAE